MVKQSHLFWNQQYLSGSLDFLQLDVGEKFRSSAIGAYCNSIPGAKSILDVGCGTGVLLDYLNPRFRSRYIGIDISYHAVRKAKLRGVSARVADAHRFVPIGPVDVVVFNEVLYYTDYAQCLARYLSFLSTKGVIIISNYNSKLKTEASLIKKIWKIADQRLIREVSLKVHSTVAGRVVSWDVKGYSRSSVTPQ